MPQMMMDLMSGFVQKIGPKLTDFLKRATNEEYTLIKKEFEAKHSKPKSKL